MHRDIVHVTTCPYCPDESGRVQVEPRAARLWRPRRASVNRRPDQRVVLFGPAGECRGPCSHVVYLSVELNVDGRSVALGYLHPWFAEHDPHGFTVDYLWEGLVEGGDPQFEAETPCGVREIETTSAARRRHGEETGEERVRLFSWTVVAEDAPLFCEELRRGEQLHQARLEQRLSGQQQSRRKPVP